jgi:hypothetical protein
MVDGWVGQMAAMLEPTVSMLVVMLVAAKVVKKVVVMAVELVDP